MSTFTRPGILHYQSTPISLWWWMIDFDPYPMSMGDLQDPTDGGT